MTIKTLYLFLGLLLTAVMSCSRHQPSSSNDKGYNSADTIVSDIGDERDFERLLVVCDSMEKAGELPKVRSIFYSSIAYNLMGQYRQSLQLYYELAKMDVSELQSEADLECYIYSYKDYVRLLCDMRRYDRALREAYNADHKLRAAGHESFVSHHDIAQIIGESQLCLGQDAEAAKSFQKSLQSIKARLAKHADPLDLRECQKTINAIATVYMRCRQIDKAAQWIAREDSLYALAVAHPRPDSIYLDEMKAEISYCRAMLAHAQGRTAEAEKAYADYLSTQSAKQPGNIINSCRYLMATHRYDEAARKMAMLDAFMSESGYEPDLENIGRFMIPKFHVNLLAGRRDSALHVATQIAMAYDSALVRQKKIDADLISTVYDTEGKERQIAEQRAKLSQQRLFTIIIVMIILIVFFLTYTIQRSRDFRKLKQANERAEESSRMKTKFIQQISHEVRTPLNVISGFTQVLASPNIEISSNDLQSISQKIVDNSERITRLVDKMLDLSEVYSNKDIKISDTVTPADIADLAIVSSGIRQARHLGFELQQQPGLESLTFLTNQKKAAKALVMLLDNAIKFTHPLAFTAQQERPERQHVALCISRHGQQLQFVVEDTGIGVPPEQAENIFTEFVQLNEYTDGTGLGLSIARSLVRHMGGDITLDTSYAPGARFVMTLPC